MIHIAVVEDDTASQKQLQSYLSRFETATAETFQITIFSDGHEIAYNYKALYDIILMDIELGVVDGMKAAELIRKLDREVVIIFITNLPQYAIQGYSVEALDYILKPVSYYMLSQTLERAIERMNRRKQQHIRVNIGRGQIKKLEIGAIYYIEVQEHILIYHTVEGDFSVSGTMRDLEKQLTDKGFFRCNKGFLINLQHVESFQGGCATVGGDQVQISRSKKKPFLDALNNYLGEVAK